MLLDGLALQPAVAKGQGKLRHAELALGLIFFFFEPVKFAVDLAALGDQVAEAARELAEFLDFRIVVFPVGPKAG